MSWIKWNWKGERGWRGKGLVWWRAHEGLAKTSYPTKAWTLRLHRRSVPECETHFSPPHTRIRAAQSYPTPLLSRTHFLFIVGSAQWSAISINCHVLWLMLGVWQGSYEAFRSFVYQKKNFSGIFSLGSERLCIFWNLELVDATKYIAYNHGLWYSLDLKSNPSSSTD